MARFALAALALSAAVAAADTGKPNVLFIAVDDLRPELGCYGHPLVQSPNIDKLAARGTVFNRAYCQQAVCSPSRSSLLTGRRPDSTKVYDLVTHFRTALPDVVTLPQHFKNNGYVSRGVGKIYHGGYDDANSWSAPHEAGRARAYGPEGQKLVARLQQEAKQKKRVPKKQANRVRGLPVEAPDVADDYLNDGAIANRAIEILEEVKDKPFFLAVGFLKPHLPFVAPKVYWDLYDPAKIKLPENKKPPEGAPAYAPPPWGELRAYHGMPKAPNPVPDETARQLIHGYYASVSYMDAQVGKVLAALDRLKLADNTVIILWGDHGWQLGEYGAWCKHSNYETSTRAALVMSRPGQKGAGKKTNALVEFVDIYPSLAELCGLPKPDGAEGMSFAPLLDDPTKSWKSAAFSQYPRGKRMGYAMRTDRYRLVEWVGPGEAEKEYELYDHRSDPGETVNVASRPENATVLKELTAQLHAGWKAATPK
jgi:arylsulfatase A-like enzyme